MTKLALEPRDQAIKKLQQEAFDILIIGGGITGVGAAQDAASRGLKVALIERGDYAIGTSSRSSKLIHGGLRYLAQGNFRVTYESCAERALLQDLAPHLVKPLSFLVPIYRLGHGLMVFTGLWLYDIVSMVKNSRFHQRVSAKKACEMVPMLESQGLHLGFLYHDCQTNDSRLVMEVIKSAASYNAISCNYLEASDLIKEQNFVVGAKAKDLITGQEISIRAKQVINATGVWLDKMCQADEPQSNSKVRPAKGVHITIARSRIPSQQALLFESAYNDKRSLFFIPWYEGIIIGTTDTDFKGNIDSPLASDEDIKYIIESTNKVFPHAKLTNKDILSSYAGLRPLIDEGSKSTKDISREHRIFESNSGLISIAGGKLTTYRLMANQLMDVVLKSMKVRNLIKEINPTITDKIFLSGFTPNKNPVKLLQTLTWPKARKLGIDDSVADHLVEDYGTNVEEILSIVKEQPDLSALLTPTLPFIQAEVIYCVRAEQATHLDDFLVRRSRIAFLSADQGVSVASSVAHLMGQELNWSQSKIETELHRYKESFATQYQVT
ncbi:MAG: glycerol-3-phosphate dehydrogenase/oxidase [Acidobacteria bacterium]|nr:glycerol-3-phosphate dehydrogenase/oxidase [Acidobacteriota bacterium]